MATEFEIKLRAGNVRQLEKILKDPQVAGRALEKLREIHMKTTYYDTADGALSSRKWMLRVRQENEKSVVTMKTPGSGSSDWLNNTKPICFACAISSCTIPRWPRMRYRKPLSRPTAHFPPFAGTAAKRPG